VGEGAGGLGKCHADGTSEAREPVGQLARPERVGGERLRLARVVRVVGEKGWLCEPVGMLGGARERSSRESVEER
jgi:hypothetical protein